MFFFGAKLTKRHQTITQQTRRWLSELHNQHNHDIGSDATRPQTNRRLRVRRDERTSERTQRVKVPVRTVVSSARSRSIVNIATAIPEGKKAGNVDRSRQSSTYFEVRGHAGAGQSAAGCSALIGRAVRSPTWRPGWEQVHRHKPWLNYPDLACNDRPRPRIARALSAEHSLTADSLFSSLPGWSKPIRTEITLNSSIVLEVQIEISQRRT